jgi:hypothetical protein
MIALLPLGGLGARGVLSAIVVVLVSIAAYGYIRLQSVEPKDRPPRR